MIQRVQSIYLVLASLALFALFLFPVANVFDTDGAKKITITGVHQNIEGQMVQTDNFILLTVATVILAVLPLVLIFLYKNRKKQMLYTYLLIVVVIAYSFWLSKVLVGATSNALQLSDYSIGAGLSSICVLFLVLAAKAINRDEKLVKSADRLR
jgi:formate hydrogenlyase subunit 3/multisubunit Na+/H+ antiporter MnhD subunit